MKLTERKVLKGIHLPRTIKHTQTGYLTTLNFKNIYLYLTHNKLPSSKTFIRQVETQAEKYLLLDL